MTYQPPKHLAQVLQKIEFEEALEPTDPRFVDTTVARGSDDTFRRFHRKFGWSPPDFYPPGEKHILFFGHIGAGKTTELRRYSVEMAKTKHFFVVEVNVTLDLDSNNLQYADALLAMARHLFEKLAMRTDVKLPADALKPLEGWFGERVHEVAEAKELSAMLEVQAEAGITLMLLAKFLTKFTASYRNNVTYKESLRKVIRNSFAQLAELFNTLLLRIEDALTAAEQRDVRVLFVLDGTDKLRGEDTKRFFGEDVGQLLAIRALVVYTAPISMKYEGNLTASLDADLVLPMIKLKDRAGQPFHAGLTAMRAILLHRADKSLFATDKEVDDLVVYSGGHPRELLKLLKLCCEFADGTVIDAPTVVKAVKQLASEYQRFLTPTDYALLAELDRGGEHNGNDQAISKLLNRLALLEYNDGSWRRTHPVVRTLSGYKRADKALGDARAVR